ncbi:hypothetical protein V1511DRAFT_449812, partial [Dipodascopsis uninucleata]
AEDGKHECQVCKKRFKKLEDHMWTHLSQPKPHRCRAGFTPGGQPSCPYVTIGFARPADRNRHELKHFTGRFVCPFGIESCSYGGERFGRLDTFKRHLKTVHGAGVSESSRSNSPYPESPQSQSTQSEPQRRKRRTRSKVAKNADTKLTCENCSRVYDGVDAFTSHLNECTYSLMHPNETNHAELEIDESD